MHQHRFNPYGSMWALALVNDIFRLRAYIVCLRLNATTRSRTENPFSGNQVSNLAKVTSPLVAAQRGG